MYCARLKCDFVSKTIADMHASLSKVRVCIRTLNKLSSFHTDHQNQH